MNGRRKTSLVAGTALLCAVLASPPVPAASPPGEVRWPSHVGEVVFPHAMHVEDLGLACTACHHPARAARLVTPHPRILGGELRRCALCHREPAREAGRAGTAGSEREYRCASCHGPRTTRAGDFPGLRVALHATCARCHEIGTGVTASASCATCHSGAPTPWRSPAGGRAREGRE